MKLRKSYSSVHDHAFHWCVRVELGTVPNVSFLLKLDNISATFYVQIVSYCLYVPHPFETMVKEKRTISPLANTSILFFGSL